MTVCDQKDEKLYDVMRQIKDGREDGKASPSSTDYSNVFHNISPKPNREKITNPQVRCVKVLLHNGGSWLGNNNTSGLHYHHNVHPKLIVLPLPFNTLLTLFWQNYMSEVNLTKLKWINNHAILLCLNYYTSGKLTYNFMIIIKDECIAMWEWRKSSKWQLLQLM